MRRADGPSGRRGPGTGNPALRGRATLAVCAAAGLAALLAACGPASGAATGGSAPGTGNGSTVTYAEQPGGIPGYPFPFIGATLNNNAAVTMSQWDSIYNLNYFQYLMYRPLYWFGTGVEPYANKKLSLAYPPIFSGHKVTIRMKSNYKWSNGQPVDAQDVVFWMNMMKEQGPNDVDYSTTGLPGDVTNVKAASKYVVTMDITSPQFSQSWFANNELSEITPMPLAWDRTAAGPSNCATVVASCGAVFDYLSTQALKNPSTFATSPLWSIVDGPWKLQSMDSQGGATLVFNKDYSGPVAANHITKFIELPYTSEQAEYNVLQDPTGGQAIDVGYLPTVDAPVPPPGSSVGANASSLPGYSLDADYAWSINYFPYNFGNTTGQGAIFDQLYFREAFQSLVDQEGVIAGPLHGYGKPTIGPVGNYPVTKYLSPQLEAKGDQWTLNLSKAKTLLSSNGWSVVPNGTDTCTKPGIAVGDCGAKIPAGAKLSFSMIYPTGIDWMQSAVRELVSNASLVGIQISATAESFNQVTGTAFNPGNHSWQLAEWGGWTYAPDYLPTGDVLFEGGAPNNAGGYNNPQNNALIKATLDARTPSEFDAAMYKWQNFLAYQLPVVYEPDTPILVETIKGLDIGPQNSAYTITPEDWHYLK